MSNDLEQRVDALEKDMAEVRADVAVLKGQAAQKPQDVDAMIDGLLYAAVKDAADAAQEKSTGK